MFNCFVFVEADDLILEDEKPHTLASVLKLFFRQLPEPIVPQQFYDDFVRSTGKLTPIIRTLKKKCIFFSFNVK